MTAVANDQRTGRALISDDLFDSIARFVVQHSGRDRATAERITDQAVAFVATTARATVPMVPSDDVDEGVHAFILHTADYRAFSDEHAGRFLHHNPRPGGGGRTVEAVTATARAMKSEGFMVFDDLWTVDGANAAQCDADCGRPYGSTEGR